MLQIYLTYSDLQIVQNFKHIHILSQNFLCLLIFKLYEYSIFTWKYYRFSIWFQMPLHIKVKLNCMLGVVKGKLYLRFLSIPGSL